MGKIARGVTKLIYHAVWQLLLYFYRKLPSKILSVHTRGFLIFFTALKIPFIWNRQRKYCGAAVKLYCILPRRATEKTPKGAPPLDSGGGGGSPPGLPPGLCPVKPLPPFQQCLVYYNKDVILSRMCTYAVQLNAIWLPLLGRQIRAFSFVFQIKYRMYLSSQTVYTRMRFYRPVLAEGDNV